MEPAAVPDSRNLTVDEILAEIETMTDHDRFRTIGAGKAWAVGLRGWCAEDLFNEALTRLAEDERHIPRNINFTYGVQRIMQSLANERREQQSRYWVDNDDEQPDRHVDEDSLAELVQAEVLDAWQARVGNDSTASDVLNLKAQGYKPGEICELLGIKRKTYDSATKRIRRAVLKNIKEQADE